MPFHPWIAFCMGTSVCSANAVGIGTQARQAGAGLLEQRVCLRQGLVAGGFQAALHAGLGIGQRGARLEQAAGHLGQVAGPFDAAAAQGFDIGPVIAQHRDAGCRRDGEQHHKQRQNGRYRRGDPEIFPHIHPNPVLRNCELAATRPCGTFDAVPNHSHHPYRSPMPHASDAYQDIREAVRDLCAQFPGEYFRKIDEERGYPEDFVRALTEAGWLAALIPQEYGGSGLGLTEASIIMEEINRSGGNSGACHGQMYNMGTLLRHGSDAQKREYLPRIAAGELRLQSMGVTEPTTGTDTTKIKTTAVRRGDRYVINGQKVWISRVQHSDLMILLARTTPLDQVARKSEGMSIFLVDLHHAVKHGMTIRPIPNMKAKASSTSWTG
ncbi:hypothetical protein G6F65_015636 [Rhizopus arrhizus]|nr:hypothetical protein G6F65_015636 [Rhizopus arrhizus]